MGGAVKAVGNAFSNPVRALTAVGTFGTSEIARKIPGVGQVARLPETASDNLLGTKYGKQGAPDLAGFNGGQDPASFLAQTGGAPVLANIAMGVDPKEALAGYFGKSTKDGSWEEFLGTLNQKDLDSINSVHGQLTTIQQDRTLRQTAVDKVVQDFPNIVQQNMKTYGDQFDSSMKEYVNNALQGTAAKYAANGQISSGAANEAFAKVGAEQGLNRLNYATENATRDAGLRLAEVNALRDFQNTMLGGQVQQGFSAQQANLQRQFAGQQSNAEMANQRYMQDQGSKNALFGAIGSLGGSFLGAKMLGANIFGAATPQTGNLISGKSGYSNNSNMNVGSQQSLYGQLNPFGPSRYF